MYPLFSLQMAMAKMAWDAQVVIALRMMKISSIRPSAQREMVRMTAEKVPAFIDSAINAQKAALRGADATEITHAALRPIARKAKANRRRLTK